MGSKSKNKDRDRERSPTSGHKKKHKRRGSRSPENDGGGSGGGGGEKHKKSKKSKHRHHDRDSESPGGGGGSNNGHLRDVVSGGESPSMILADEGFLSKSPDRQHQSRQQSTLLDDNVRDYHHRSDANNSLYERRTTREFSPLGEEDIVSLEKSATPPPPVPAPSRREAPVESPLAANNGGDASSLSIEETNRIRAKLGLKPLEVPGAKKDEAPSGGLQEDIHAPASNIGRDKEKEKIKEKLELIKEKRYDCETT